MSACASSTTAALPGSIEPPSQNMASASHLHPPPTAIAIRQGASRRRSRRRRPFCFQETPTANLFSAVAFSATSGHWISNRHEAVISDATFFAESLACHDPPPSNHKVKGGTKFPPLQGGGGPVRFWADRFGHL